MFRVATYNVEYSGWRRPATLDAIATIDADVVLLQEVTPPWQRVLHERFGRAYPHARFHAAHGAGGLAALSRLPIDEDRLLPATDWFPAQRLVVAGVQVLHVHLHPMIDGGDWVRGYFTTPPIRRREIASYLAALTDLPTLVAGDFNEEPGGAALELLASRGIHRADSGAAPTFEWKGSWRGNDIHLRLRLDHLCHDARLIVSDPRVVTAGASDHYAVVATVGATTGGDGQNVV